MKPVFVAEEIAAAVSITSHHRIGAVILVEPTGTVGGGVVLDARVSRELLVAIFVPEYINRIHQGTVIVRGDRVERAGVPVTWATIVERAADLAAGVAVAVDDNNGEIRIADRTGRVEVVDADVLADALRRHALKAGPR